MKKVSVFHKVVAVIAVLAFIMSVVNFVLILRTDDLARNYLNGDIRSNSGAINRLIDCVNGDKYSCDTLEQQ